MARSNKWEAKTSMHVCKACTNGTLKTSNCTTAVDCSDESEPTAWKPVYCIIKLFKELRRSQAGEIIEPSPPEIPSSSHSVSSMRPGS